MTKAQMLDMLTEQAREFRKDTNVFRRNNHMHKMRKQPSQTTIDAILVSFINQVGTMQGLDYGLYTKHL